MQLVTSGPSQFNMHMALQYADTKMQVHVNVVVNFCTDQQ